MIIQNVPKSCSYKNIGFFLILAVFMSYISYASSTSGDVLNFFNNNAQISDIVMAKILPFLFFATCIVLTVRQIKRREEIKQPQNIKEVKIEKSGIEFRFYDPFKNFSITEDKLMGLEIVMNIFERRKSNTRYHSRHSNLFSSRYTKETVIDEIALIFTLADNQKFEIVNAPSVPMDTIYQIFENFNNIHKIQYSFNGKGDTKKIEEDIEYFYENRNRRLLINELREKLLPVATIIFLVLLFLYIYITA